MATRGIFDEIETWQHARELTRAVHACLSSGPYARDFGLCDQIRRSAVSVMSNIAEGVERGGNAEFIHSLSIAKGSVAEVVKQRYGALDQQYINDV